MAKPLLASVYFQTNHQLADPNSNVTRNYSVRNAADTSWSNTSDLTSTVTYLDKIVDGNGKDQFRYRIDVNLVAATTGESPYLIHKAGTHRYRLGINVNVSGAYFPSALTYYYREFYITVQPDVRIYCKDSNSADVNLVQTDETTLCENPLKLEKTVELVNNTAALAARTVLMASPNYGKTVFIKSNASVDAYCTDFVNKSGLWIKDKIQITRPVPTLPLLGNTPASGSVVNFVADAGALLRDTVSLTLAKGVLARPLNFQTTLTLSGRSVARYTGVGTNTLLTNPPFSLPLSIILQTPPIPLKITTPEITLNEDNNYTSFVTVETNDDADWTLTPDNDSLSVLPSAGGTGKEARVVKINPDTFDWDDEDFHTIELTAESGVNSATANVHIERFTPTKNALIPWSASAGSLDNSLTATTTKTWSGGTYNGSNLASFPYIEVELGAVHRIRSWSLQSVGVLSGQRRATRLILSGKRGDGDWKILDDTQASLTAGTSGTFYLASKPRVDRTTNSKELVDTIRITAVAATTDSGDVRFPQIQVFAGEPVMPRMTANGLENVTIYPNDPARLRVFDREVAGSNIAHVGSASWYLNSLANAVAKDGIISRFVVDPNINVNDAQSLGYIAVIFPKKRLIGYLYSLDDLSAGQDTPYAASLYFEGRETANTNVVFEDSEVGEWDEIGLISLDKCIGNSTDITPNLQNEQTTLDGYADNVLGLTGSGKDKAFIIDTDGSDKNVIQYSDSANQWQNKGSQYPDAISDVDNQTHYADFANVQEWSQFRFSAKSVMNTTPLTNKPYNVAMPEFQFFGLPTDPINTGDVATVSFLKAEASGGVLHDILGRHQTLRRQANTAVRLYVGTPQNISTSDTKLYLAFQNTSTGAMTEYSQAIGASFGDNVPWTYSNTSNVPTVPTYYEIYIYDKLGKKIILSSGYTGGTT